MLFVLCSLLSASFLFLAFTVLSPVMPPVSFGICSSSWNYELDRPPGLLSLLPSQRMSSVIPHLQNKPPTFFFFLFSRSEETPDLVVRSPPDTRPIFLFQDRTTSSR